MRLILVEDNERLAGFVAKGLRNTGFTVDVLGSGADAQAALATTTYDAMVLDLGLPDVDGMAMLKKLRSGGNNLPILVLTARDGIGDRVKGLDAGADDYMVKPFAIEEMSARLRALLRRPTRAVDKAFRLGNVSFDAASRELLINGVGTQLARREIDILEQLLRRVNHVVPKAVLEHNIFGIDDEVSPNALEVAMSRLRKSLRQANADVEVITFRNLGYMLRKAH
jgi:two-component system response regulator QseB